MIRLFFLLVFLFGACSSFAFAQPAQPFRIGVVVSQTGAARLDGAAQADAVTALGTRLRRMGTFSQTLEVSVRDDASDPATALRQVRDLVENGSVHALVCCTTAAATKAVAPYVEASGVLTLALSSLPPDPGFWLFTVIPDDERLLQSVVLRQAAAGQTRFGLMTLDNGYGNAAAAALARLFDPGANTSLVVEQRYSPAATVLTPEALWVATRVPDTVFVWGLAQDSALAYAGLRARGYEKDVVLNPALLEPGTRVDPASFTGGLFPVSPAALSVAPPAVPSYESLQTYRRDLAGSYPAGRVPSAGAFAYDAVALLEAAYEAAYTYGVPLDNVTALRGVLRDAFVGMGAVTGATAVFDYDEADHVGVVPSSLVLARLTPNGLVAP